MNPPNPSFILASGSPRRRQLLESLAANFVTIVADVDETPLPGEDPSELALRLARSKARAVAARNPGLPVLAADTVVALGTELLAKPQDEAENVEFLAKLSGKPHQVITGHVLLAAGEEAAEAPVTTVAFRQLALPEMQRYAATREGLDKAGGYGLQGLGGVLVESISGCHTNVIGLSVPAVLRLFDRLKVGLV